MKLEWGQKSLFPMICPERWSIAFSVPKGASGVLFRACSETGTEILCAELTVDQLEIRLHYDANIEPLTLHCTVSFPSQFVLSAKPERVALFSNGKALDEEWPLGAIQFAGAEYSARIPAVFSDAPVEDPPFHEERFTDVDRWKPAGENTNVGDCMPFADGDLYRIYYLFDRRHHKSKWGRGAHQWAQISSPDLIHWKTHPMAIGIDEQYEASICTGSVIRCGKIYYAFYAVRMADRSPARLTWATSPDGDHFTKSGRYITLKAPYESVSARDPKVFRTEDGIYHMLVTTSIAEKKVGALAHLTSKDMIEWEQLDPFVALDEKAQPECSDYFRFGEWYYLIYSTHGTARWYRSRFPLGPWEAPEGNLVAGQTVGVPKAAVFHNRLIFTGFSNDGKGYGGNFLLYEAFASGNGDLRFEKIERTETR